MLRLLIATAALLIYGSLYPWQFHEGRPGGPLATLLGSWQLSFNRFGLRDIALNIAIYIPFGAAAYLWLSSRPAAVRFGLPILLAAILSAGIELAQFYDARRYTSLVDVATNVLGAAAGMLLATTVAKRGSRSAIRIQQPGALFLFFCWLLAFLFPLIPDFSRTHLTQKVAGFFDSPFSAVAFISLLVSWLLAARLLQAVFGELIANTIFPILAFTLPARFLVLGLRAGWEYWATFFLAWLVWTAFLSELRRRNALLAWLTILSILAVGLSPFHWSEQAQVFAWAPFRALFSTSWEVGFAILMNKAFLYGSAVWLLYEAGWPMRYAALFTMIVLAGVEALQTHIPGHAAEITDPLLCLLIAWILHRLARARAPSQVVGKSKP